MTHKKLTPMLLMSAATFAVTIATAQAAPPKPKISKQQAMAAAIKKIPGKATAAVYEFEDGRWQYAVSVITAKGQMYEAAVSSTTGKVTTVEKTTPAEEATEAAADKKAAMKAKSATMPAHKAK